MTRLRLSAVLCSYNGARFLADQLRSIREQSRSLDELVICDDRSTDNTVEIVRDFAATVAFPVRLYLNETTLRSTKNFEKGIALATGDVIVLSDQDDEWCPERLATTEAVFLADPTLAMTFGDAELTDENLVPLGRRLWDRVAFRAKEQKKVLEGNGLDVLFKKNVVTGATMAFRAEWRDLVLPIPSEWVHDGWIAYLIGSCGKISCINEPLIRYRQHRGQQLGAAEIALATEIAAKRNESPAYYQRACFMYELAVNRLGLKRPECIRQSHLDKVTHLKARRNMPAPRALRLPAILREMLLRRYSLYANGWRSAMVDMARH